MANDRDLAAAQDRLTRGVEASRRVGDRYYLPRDLKALAEVKAERGQLADAHRLYLRAEDIIDGMLAHSPGPYTKSSLVGAMSSIYIGDFTLAAHQRDTATAFTILERVRGRTAADMLRNHSIPVHESASDRAFEEEVSSLQVRLMRSDDVQERSQLRDSLVEAEERLNYNRESLARVSLLISGHSVLLRAAQDMLRPDETLLEYVLAEPVAFCLTLTRERAAVVTLPVGGKKIEALVSGYLSAINDRRPADKEEMQLYSLLLDPIPISDRKLRFVIVPDGRLHMLPFESLRDGTGRYVIWNHILSYAPSATALQLLRNSKRVPAPQLSFLGVGDVRYEADRLLLASNSATGRILRAVTRGFDELVASNLSDLPASRQELEEASRTLRPANAVLLMGEAATETAFKKQPLANFRIIHIAAHAVAEPRFPERAALVLGFDPNSHEDGLLQAREIAGLQLNADLVTLSACDTAKGKLQGEEGNSSLVQAFLLAGAKSVVAALWEIDDKPTEALMKNFYGHLAHGMEKASALHQAKLDLLNDFGDYSPQTWAGFTLVGDGGSSIKFSK